MKNLKAAKQTAKRNVIIFGTPFMVCRNRAGRYGISSLAADIPSGWTFVCVVA